MKSRGEKVKELLQPIEWTLDKPLKYRQAIVLKRRESVVNAYPLLTDDEKVLADKWFENEKHSGLWD